MHGMTTSTRNRTSLVGATDVHFTGTKMRVSLSDGREITVPTEKIKWLRWLAKATPRQRAKWSLEPGGFAIYWNDLDDGVEICHLLATQPMA
jgi:hypothetical protein